jgi:hypothetical protein
MTKEEFISEVSKINSTGEDEFRAAYNSPEKLWDRVIARKLVKESDSDSEEEYDPYFGGCDVEGCEREVANCGVCWRDTGYWTVCSKHSQEYREGKPQPSMKQWAIDREKRRGKDGVLIGVK